MVAVCPELNVSPGKSLVLVTILTLEPESLFKNFISGITFLKKENLSPSSISKSAYSIKTLVISAPSSLKPTSC